MVESQKQAKSTQHPQIAIVGMAGRFPGASNVEALWTRILSASVAPLSSLETRWNIPRERYFSADASVADRTSLDRAFCLSDDVPKALDRQLHFGRSVIEEALDDLGASGLSPREVALVCGTSWSGESYFDADTARVLGRDSRAHGTTAQAQLDDLAPLSRIAGPRLAVDTACASSLYAIDVAIGLLTQGIARRVVVLGLNAALPPWLFVGFTKLGATSSRGEIKPFAADASGIVPGECAACVVLERLDHARAARRRVLAVVRDVGLSADGANRSVFAPAPEGQALAYARAYPELTDREVDYLEAHGTATTVGDEVELRSLHTFFEGVAGSDTRIPLGSIKALIGHTLAAAGLASLIKAVLILQKRVIPPHVSVTPHPELSRTCLELPEAARVLLPHASRPLRVGISSFGFGGANAHLVVEEDVGRSELDRIPARCEGPWLHTPLAILDLELAIGKLVGAEVVQRQLAEPLHFEAPSESRFWFVSEEERTRLGAGHFLPEKLEIDAKGLRMGPNFLRRLDGLQLLLLELSHRISVRTPSFAGQSDSATVISNSLGGEKSTALARRHAAIVGDGPVAFQGGEMTLEHIASSLPTMCSGYPAYHFNARGFHQTLCGGPATFLTSLLLAPYWLEHGVSRLLLGGARLIKSPLDVEGTVAACRDGKVPQAEGAGLFLLSRLDRAEAAGERVLGVIRAIVPRDRARNGVEACAVLGLDPENIDRFDTCQLAPHLAPEASSTQAWSGFFDEATGVETLARALLGEARTTLIEVKHGQVCLFSLLIERSAAFDVSTPPPSLPIPIAITPRPVAAVRAPHASVCVEKIVAPSQQTEAASPAVPANPLNPHDEDVLRSWLSHARSAMHSYFEAQRAAAGLLHTAAQATASQVGRTLRPDAHVVIDRPRRNSDGALCAEARVDDRHPYFFDHPLDHVPGILLVDAIQQLGEQELGEGEFLSGLSLRFMRFCDKQSPTQIVLAPAGDENRQVRIVQGAQVAAVGVLQVVTAQPVVRTERADTTLQPETDIALLHKKRAENVLVTPLVETRECVSTRALRPAAQHALSAGDPTVWSLTYLLEVGRQALMLAAHGALGIPRNMPMNLASISISLPAPIARETPIMLSIIRQKPLVVGDVMLADIPIALSCGGHEIGEIRIKAQIVDPKTYQEQRWNA